MDPLFPKEIIDQSQEKNFSRHSVASQVIYCTLIASFLVILVLLPFIKVDVGVRSRGVIRPVAEVVPIQSPVSGKVELMNVGENDFIGKGETFAVIEATGLQERIRHNRNRSRRIKSYLGDLKKLTRQDTVHFNSQIDLESARYQKSWIAFRQHLFNRKQQVDRHYRAFQRQNRLEDMAAGSKVDREEAYYSWKASEGEYRLLVKQQIDEWELDIISFEEEWDQLESEYEQLKQEKRLYHLQSPISGTVQNLGGLLQSNYVHANQVLGEISPDTSLVAEIHIDPGDIGLLHEGMAVRLQVDAFNYNQWGIVTGKVTSLSNDVITRDDWPSYRALCAIDQSHLQLSNGAKGYLKKGMSLQARFIVSRRSLLQLLYDKVDDWINPVSNANKQATLHHSNHFSH